MRCIRGRIKNSIIRVPSPPHTKNGLWRLLFKVVKEIEERIRDFLSLQADISAGRYVYGNFHLEYSECHSIPPHVLGISPYCYPDTVCKAVGGKCCCLYTRIYNKIKTERIAWTLNLLLGSAFSRVT